MVKQYFKKKIKVLVFNKVYNKYNKFYILKF